MQLVIGAYTERLPGVDGKADGVLTASFDTAIGSIGPVATAAAARNPSYLTVSAAGGNLYAVNETLDFEGGPGGGLTAYARRRGPFQRPAGFGALRRRRRAHGG